MVLNVQSDCLIVYTSNFFSMSFCMSRAGICSSIFGCQFCACVRPKIESSQVPLSKGHGLHWIPQWLDHSCHDWHKSSAPPACKSLEHLFFFFFFSGDGTAVAAGGGACRPASTSGCPQELLPAGQRRLLSQLLGRGMTTLPQPRRCTARLIVLQHEMSRYYRD